MRWYAPECDDEPDEDEPPEDEPPEDEAPEDEPPEDEPPDDEPPEYVVVLRCTDGVDGVVVALGCAGDGTL